MKNWHKTTLYALGSLAVLSLIGRVNYIDDLNQITSRQVQQRAAVTQASRPNAKRDLVITRFRWQKNKVGTVAYHWFTINNGSRRHTYLRIPVRFSYYSEAGDEVGRIERVIVKAIKVGETIQVDKVETALPYQHADGADLEIME
ncbi:hypothetical protein GCM10028806_05670 [Spirosoma terrae]|uniref:Uncharacterized protein n=1 Tax=Spirosoma terrae TaxID=1968276 RepID=A0A6L9LD64_9BACT|nr:hypothetical protein [Spirosoma terrae]NDU98495.1 hypothetical protein [Spirosoma terrae]